MTSHKIHLPRDGLVLEVGVELGRVEVRDEGGRQHRHQDESLRVHRAGARENGPGVLREAGEEASSLHVAVFCLLADGYIADGYDERETWRMDHM